MYQRKGAADLTGTASRYPPNTTTKAMAVQISSSVNIRNSKADAGEAATSVWRAVNAEMDATWQGRNTGLQLVTVSLSECEKEASPSTWNPPKLPRLDLQRIRGYLAAHSPPEHEDMNTRQEWGDCGAEADGIW